MDKHKLKPGKFILLITIVFILSLFIYTLPVAAEESDLLFAEQSGEYDGDTGGENSAAIVNGDDSIDDSLTPAETTPDAGDGAEEAYNGTGDSEEAGEEAQLLTLKNQPPEDDVIGNPEEGLAGDSTLEEDLLVLDAGNVELNEGTEEEGKDAEEELIVLANLYSTSIVDGNFYDPEYDLVINEDLIWAGKDITITARTIIVMEDILISTRDISSEDYDYLDGLSTGDSGSITLTAQQITIRESASILTHANGTYSAGDITMTAGIGEFTTGGWAADTAGIYIGGGVKIWAQATEPGQEGDVTLTATMTAGSGLLDLLADVDKSKVEIDIGSADIRGGKVEITATADHTRIFWDEDDENDTETLLAKMMDIGLETGIEFLEEFSLFGGVAISNTEVKISLDQGAMIDAASLHAVAIATNNAATAPLALGVGVAVGIIKSDVEVSIAGSVTTSGDCYIRAASDNTLKVIADSGSVSKLAFAVAVSLLDTNTTAQVTDSAVLNVGGDLTVWADTVDRNVTLARSVAGKDGMVGIAAAVCEEVNSTNAFLDGNASVAGNIKVFASQTKDVVEMNKFFGLAPSVNIGVMATAGVGSNSKGDLLGDQQGATTTMILDKAGALFGKIMQLIGKSSGDKQEKTQNQANVVEVAGGVAVYRDINTVTARIGNPASTANITIEAGGDITVHALVSSAPFVSASSAIEDSAPEGSNGENNDKTKFAGSAAVALGFFENTAIAYIAGDVDLDAGGELQVRAEAINDWVFEYGKNLWDAYWGIFNSPEKYNTSNGTVTIESDDIIRVFEGYGGGGEGGHLYKYIGIYPGMQFDLGVEDYTDENNWEDLGVAWFYGMEEFIRIFTTYLDDSLGLSNNCFNTWSQSTASGDAEVSIAGAVSIVQLTNNAHAYIDGGAKINQNETLRSGEQRVAVEALVVNEAIHLGGNISLPGITGDIKEFKLDFKASPTGTSGDTAAVGGGVMIIFYDNESVAEIRDGAVVYADSLKVDAETKVFSISLSASGGEGGTFGFNGVFSLIDVDSRTYAGIDSGAQVTVGILPVGDSGAAVFVSAEDYTFIINISGGVAVSQSIGIGASVSINDLKRDTQAYIGENINAAAGAGKPENGEETLVSGGNVLVTATNDGFVASFSLAAAVSKDKSGNDQKSKQKEGSKFGLGVSADISINMVDDTALAYIRNAVLSAQDVTLYAANDMLFISASGSVAIVKKEGTSIGLAGSFSENTAKLVSRSFVDNSDLTLEGDLDASASTRGRIISVAASGAAAPGDKGYAIAGQVSLNSIGAETEAALLNGSAVEVHHLTLSAADTSKILAVAGALSYGGKAGIGAALAINELPLTGRGSTTARIEGAQVTASGDIILDAASSNYILAITAALGASTDKEGLAAAFSVSSNTVDHDTSAYIKLADVTAGTITLTATDDSAILSFAGAVGYGGKASLGAAAAYNEINNTVTAYIDQSAQVKTTSSLTIWAVSDAAIMSISAGGGYGGKITANGSVSVNTITNQTAAYINDSAVAGDTGVFLIASDTSEIGSIAGALGASKETALGAAVAVNLIGGLDGKPHQVYAFIQDSEVISSQGPVRLSAQSDTVIKSISAAGAASGKTAANGSVSVNWIFTDVAVLISGCSATFPGTDKSRRVKALENITLYAADNSAISVIAGTISSGSKDGIGAAVALVIIGNGKTPGFDVLIENPEIEEEDEGEEGDEEEDLPDGAYDYELPDFTDTAKVRAVIENSEVETTAGLLTLSATANNVVFNIAAGAATGGRTGVQGSVAVNYLYSNVWAQIIDSQVDAAGDITLLALSLKRETIPQGALQVKSDNQTQVSEFNGDDESEDDPRTITSIQSMAGAIAGGGKAGVGVTLAVNYMANSYLAGISGSTVSAGSDVVLLAGVNNTIEALSAAIVGSKKLAFAGALSVNLINNEVIACIVDSNVHSATTDMEITAGRVPGITLTAYDKSVIQALAGQVNFSGKAGIGAAFAYNEINNRVLAYVDSSTLTNSANLQIKALSDATILSIAAGGGFGGKFSANGSVSVNTIGNEVSSHIKSSDVEAGSGVFLFSHDRSGIGSVAGAIGGAGSVAIGAAVAVNRIGSANTPHRVYSFIEESAVVSEYGPVFLSAQSDTIIKSISAAGGFAGKVAANGAVSLNWIYTDVAAYISGSSGSTFPGDKRKRVEALGDITLYAADNSAVSVIAGTISGAGTAGIGAAAAVVFIGNGKTPGTENPADNPIIVGEEEGSGEDEDLPEGAYDYDQPDLTDSGKVRAFIINSEVTSIEGAVTLSALSNLAVFNITAGAAIGGTAGVQGSVSVNYIFCDVLANIHNSQVTAQKDITLEALSVKRSTIPRGALQLEWDHTEVGEFDGGGGTKDEDGNDTEHGLTSIQSLAGAVAGGGTAGAGVAIAVNHITNIFEASITGGSTVTADRGSIILRADAGAGLETVSAALAGGGTLAFAGAVSVNFIQNQLLAHITDSTVSASPDYTDLIEGYNPGVILIAKDSAAIKSVSGQVNFSGTVGIGAAAAYNEIGSRVHAYLGQGSSVITDDYITIVALSDTEIGSIASGGGFSGIVSVNGSVSINTIGNDTAAYIKGADLVAADRGILLEARDASHVGSVAGYFAGAVKVSVGTSVAANNIGSPGKPHRVHSYIEDALVISDAGSISLKAESETLIKNLSFAGDIAGIAAVNGAVSVNWIYTDTAVYIIDCTSTDDSKLVQALGDITLTANDKSAVSIIATNVAVGVFAGVGASIGIVFIGSGEISEDSPEDSNYDQPAFSDKSKVRAEIINSTVSSDEGSVKLTATVDTIIFNTSAGAAGGFGGVQGSVSVNYIHSEVAARISGSDVEAGQDILLSALALSRNTIPQGALQVDSDSNPAESYDGGADKRDDEYVETDPYSPERLTSIQAVAGSIAGGAVGVGMVVAVNHIVNKFEAAIIDSTAVAGRDIRLTADCATGIETVSAALAGGLSSAAASVSLNWIKNEIVSHITRSSVTSNNPENPVTPVTAADAPGITVLARDRSVINSVSGQVNFAGTSIGAAAAYNEINNTVKAYIEDCQGTTNGIISSGNLVVWADSRSTITTIAAGGSLGGFGGVSGTVAINIIANETEAFITDAVVTVDDNIYILAESINTTNSFGGSVAGGAIGLGAAMVVNVINNNTLAYISGSDVTARGSGPQIRVKWWSEAGVESFENTSGLIIIADNKEALTIYSGAAGAGMGAVSGQISANVLFNTTEAYISASTINSSTELGAFVIVRAHQDTGMQIYAGSLAIGGVAVGAALDATVIMHSTSAYIDSSVVYALRGVEVWAMTNYSPLKQNTPSLIIAGAAASGMVSVAGAVSVLVMNNETEAAIRNSTVMASGFNPNAYIRVYSHHNVTVDVFAGTVSGSFFVGAGGSVVVSSFKNTSRALAEDSYLSARGAIEIIARSRDIIIIKAGTAGVGITGAGVAGAVTVTLIETTTEAFVLDSGLRRLYLSSQTALIRAVNNSTVSTIGGALGAGTYAGVGAAIDYVSIRNRTVAMVGTGSRVYTSGNATVEAESNKTVHANVYSFGGGLLGLSGAISIVSIGSAIDPDGAAEFNDDLKNQLDQDLSLNSLLYYYDDNGQSESRLPGDATGNKALAFIIAKAGAPDLVAALDPDADTGTRITAAFVQNADGTGSRAEIRSTNGTVTIRAVNRYTVNTRIGNVAAGAVGLGAAVGIVTVTDTTRAYVGDYAQLRARNLSVSAESFDTASVLSRAAAGGLLFTTSVNLAKVTLAPVVESHLGRNTNVRVTGNVDINAEVTPQASAEVFGISVATGVNVGVADARATIEPTVSAWIGENAVVVAGPNILSGNPTLTFLNMAALSGNPVLEFNNASILLENIPNITFAHAASGGDTITRSSGSWLGEGFQTGDTVYIFVAEDSPNNWTFLIQSVTADKLTVSKVTGIQWHEDGSYTLVLQEYGFFTDFTGSVEGMYVSKPSTVTRDSGSWSEDGFSPGQLINVSGTNNNNGVYLVKSISDNGTVLELDAGFDFVNETVSGSGVAITAESNDRIRRDSGSWHTDGFAPGQTIRIMGSTHNDGAYLISSISADGKELVLASKNAVTPETASGLLVNNTGDYTARVSVNAAVKGAGVFAQATGCGGGILVGINATKAEARNESTIKASLDRNAAVMATGKVTVNAYSESAQVAGSDAYNGGLLALGKSSATAGSDTVIEAAVKDNAHIRAYELQVLALGFDNNYADVTAGSGGVVSGMAAEAGTDNTSSTGAVIGNNIKIFTDRFLLMADHLAAFNSRVNTLNAALVGASGAKAENTVKAAVAAAIGDNADITAYDILVHAANRSQKDWLPGNAYNIRSGSGGALDLPAASSTTEIHHTTFINVGAGARLTVVGDPFEPGSLTMNAVNVIEARDKVRVEAGGAIVVARADSSIEALTNTATVNIGSNARLTSVGDINMSARSVAELETRAEVKTWGGAGAAQGSTLSRANAQNEVVVGGGAKLFSQGSVNLLAGRDSDNQVNRFDLKAGTDYWNNTAFPIPTKPGADAIINQTNNITVGGGALIECVMDANLLTAKGITLTSGKGTGKDFYLNLLGLELTGGSETQTDDSVVRVDGTVRVGIRSRQVLIINADGSVAEQSEGVTFTRMKDTLYNNIMAEIERLTILAREYAGTEAGVAFKLQLEFMERELESIGGNRMIDIIVVHDIRAQTANINIAAHSLVGGGILSAMSEPPLIQITNRSPAYLVLGRLHIPESEGGRLLFNQDSVTINDAINLLNKLKQASFSKIDTSENVPAPAILVENTHHSGPAIQAEGDIRNVGIPLKPGTVTLNSTGSVYSSGVIDAGTVSISAGGNFVQSYVHSFYSVGGSPRSHWAAVITITQQHGQSLSDYADEPFIWMYPDAYWWWLAFPDHEMVPLHKTGQQWKDQINGIINNNILNPANSNRQDPKLLSEIRADNIFIAARYLNINGLIQGGRPSYDVVLGAQIESGIYWGRRLYTFKQDYTQNLIYQDGLLRIYYDVINDVIIVDDLMIRGGIVQLFGQILSTGTGKIVTRDGYGAINIDNQTNRNMVIKSLDVGQPSSGVIIITDTARKKAGEELVFLTTKYERVYNTSTGQYDVIVKTWYTDVKEANASVTSVSGSTTAYLPVTGWRFEWVNGQSAVDKITETYRTSKWLGIIPCDSVMSDPRNLVERTVERAGVPVLLPNGELVIYRPERDGEPYLYWFERFETDEPEKTYDKTTWSINWIGTVTWTRVVVWETGYKEVHHHSIRADYPITIEFEGGLAGVINVRTNRNLIVTGPVNNPAGSTTLTAGGSIEQTTTFAIITGNLSLEAGTGIGNNKPVLVEITGVLNAKTESGLINITETKGVLKLGKIENNGGNVYLAAQTNIIAENAQSLVKGGLVELTAHLGYIGTSALHLRLDTGSGDGHGIKAWAQGNIFLRETDGSLRVISIVSQAGNVTVRVDQGGLVDANGTEETHAVTVAQLLSLWQQYGIGGSGGLYTPAEVNQFVQDNLTRQLTGTMYRSEEANIRGQHITLVTSGGGIGHVIEVRIDFVSGAAALNDQGRTMLAAAERGDVTFYNAGGEPVDPAAPGAEVAYMIIRLYEDVNVQAGGTITVTAGPVGAEAYVYLGSEHDLRLNTIRAADTRIKGRLGIVNAAVSSAVNITCTNLLLEAAGGGIGTEAKPLTITVKNPASTLLSARSTENIYLSGVAAGGHAGALNLGHIYTPGRVHLQAAGFINDANHDSRENIGAASLLLSAASVGTSGNYLEIRLTASDPLNATATAGGIFLREVHGSMNMGTVSATGDVGLWALVSLLDGLNNDTANVTGRNITLRATLGGVGTAANYLEINSAHGGSGWVSASSNGNMYLREVSGNLTLTTVWSYGDVHLISPGQILDGRQWLANKNVASVNFWFQAAAGVGTEQKPLTTAVNNIEGSTDAGSIWITNSGALTVGGITANTTGISAGGAIHLTALSHLTVAKNMTAGGGIVLTAENIEGPGDDINIEAGIIVRSSGGAVTLQAGDNIIVRSDAQVVSSGLVNLDAGDDITLGSGAVITAGDSVDLDAGGNILLGSDAEVTGNGPVSLVAGMDITIGEGATVKSTGDSVRLDAGGDILLGSDAEVTGCCLVDLVAVGDITAGNNAVIQSTGNSVNFYSGWDILLNTLAEVSANGPVSLVAGNDITLGSGAAITSGDSLSLDAGAGILLGEGSQITASGPVTLDAIDDITAGSNSVITAGGSVSLDAGGNILLNTGAQIAASGSVTLAAGVDILVRSSAVVKSTGNNNPIILRAGRDIRLNEGSLLNAAGTVYLYGDCNDGSDGIGTSIDVRGEILAVSIHIEGNNDADIFNLITDTFTCPVEVYGLGGDDVFNLKLQKLSASIWMFGGDGDDTFNIDQLPSLISENENGERDTVTLDGGEGSDTYNIWVNGATDCHYIINVWDSGTEAGKDELHIYGTEDGDVFLLRRYFIAVLHEDGEEFSQEFERINYNEDLRDFPDGNSGNGIEELFLYGNDGKNRFYLDDNSAPTTIYGGDGNDFFQVGQMFGSEREAGAETGILPGDDTDTVHTTRGYLSFGISFETHIYGGAGDDTFSIYSNQVKLSLYGEDGNDTFIIRAFVLDGEPFAYHANAPVSVDGGAGFDTVVILGTEGSDTFVITADDVFGAGRSVKMVNIEALDIDGMEDDDHFFLQGTKSGMVTTVIGGLGNDSFYIMGDVTRTVFLSPDTSIETIVPHDLTAIRGPLYIAGGIKEGADRTLFAGIMLPYESSPPLPDLGLSPVDEAEMTDVVYVYNDGSTGYDTGRLKGGNLSGLGMGEDLVINMGTSLAPDEKTFNGGISYADIEILEILLGSGNDTFTVEDTATGTITAVHGGGGDNHIIINGRSGPLVVYGDTSACGTRYSSIPGVASVNGNSYNNPGNNTIDAHASQQSVVIYGGPGNDTIYGSQAGDHLAGGPGNDTIHGEGGNDIIYGDSAFNVDLWTRLLSVVTSDAGGDINTGSDEIFGGDGDDIIFGDHGSVTQAGHSAGTFSVDTTAGVALAATVGLSGGNDTISAGSGNNIVFGGVGGDVITTGDGNNIVFGDNGYIAYCSDGTAELYSLDPGVGGDDEITTGSGHDLIIGGFGDDTINAGEGNNIVLGDNGRIRFTGSVPMLIESTEPEYGGTDTITVGSGDDIVLGGVGDDRIEAVAGDNIILGDNGLIRFNMEGLPVYIETIASGYDGDDIILAGPGEDILIGGSFADVIDGGAGADLIFGDNVTLDRTNTLGEMVNPRYRVLFGTVIYDNDGNPQVTDTWQPYPSGDAPVWADWVITLHTDYGYHGNDYIAGGPGDDMIFGQGGDDTIQGDGSIQGWLDGKPVYADRDANGLLVINPSFSAATDGDDYIEGGPGSDTIFGNLGQDDIIGGSSSLFGLTESWMRPDGGDMIFGGSGDAIERNEESSTGHARDADYILGDNGNIFRLVGTGGVYSGAFLTFNYDIDYYNGNLRLMPRAVELLDYTPGGPDYDPEKAANDIGGNDEIHGEDGNDFIHGMTGDDILFGEAGDDVIIGGWGNDWISGGNGIDGILGDDGWMAISVNSTVGEPLYGVAGFAPGDLNKVISLQGGTFYAVINVAGELKMTAHLSPLWLSPKGQPFDPLFRPMHADDIIYGGLGGDFIHGGAGDDAISGAEALTEFYNAPFTAWNILRAGEGITERFAAFNPYQPLSYIRVNEDGFWTADLSGREFLLNFDPTEDAGNDVIFGGPGNDWLVGATGSNHLFGGYGDDLLDVNSRIANDSHSSYAYGGAGRDVLIANNPDDRLIDWTGEFNNYYVPFNPYGLGTVTRLSSPGLIDFLLQLSASDGADTTAGIAYGGDPARNGEPYGELGLVGNQDDDSKDQKGAPEAPHPGNKQDDGKVKTKSTETTDVTIMTDESITVLDQNSSTEEVETSTVYGDNLVNTDLVVNTEESPDAGEADQEGTAVDTTTEETEGAPTTGGEHEGGTDNNAPTDAATSEEQAILKEEEEELDNIVNKKKTK